MGVAFDGQDVFGECEAEIVFGSVGRESVQRQVAGLDGCVSVDLGRRGRTLEQKGQLRAKSKAEMNGIIDSIESFIDGRCHTLRTEEGRVLSGLRMDSFKFAGFRTSGVGVVCDYKIVYTQLRA